jgi:hypothetical protein
MLLVFLVQFVFSQDLIITIDQKEIQAKVIEIASDEIKYRHSDDGELIRSIRKSDVFVIIYENNRREYFSIANTASNSSRLKRHLFGAGAGRSYGYLGVRYQYRFLLNSEKPDFNNFAIHGAIGVSPYYTEAMRKTMFAGGIKYFPYKDLYVNAVIGTTHVENTQTHMHWNFYNVVYGASLLVGTELDFGDEVLGYGVNIGLGVTQDFNKTRPIQYINRFALDVGFFVRF